MLGPCPRRRRSVAVVPSASLAVWLTASLKVWAPVVVTSAGARGAPALVVS